MKVSLLLSLPVFLVLASCSSIRSKQLVGKEPVDLSGSIGDVQLSQIAGEWVDADGDVTSITVIDAKKGAILYGAPDTDDDPQTIELRISGDHVFANFQPDEKGERLWMLIKVQGEMKQILVWKPDTKQFRKLITEGKIKGTNDPETSLDENGAEVKNQNPGAVIDDPTGEWVEKMVTGEFGVVFDWTNPNVLRKKETEESPTEVEGDVVPTKSK